MRHEVVFTGACAVTATGVGLKAHAADLARTSPRASLADHSLRDFKAAPHLSDRRLLKAISHGDSIGLVAIEGLKKATAFGDGLYDSWERGVYVGAPPASCYDNGPYMEAMVSAVGQDGRACVREFGVTCMGSRPTTLLLGLPNNVLCYGALLLDAKGPNSNYTSSDLSGHLAVVNAARRVGRGRLRFAVAGGFTFHTEEINTNMFRFLGVARRDGEDSGSVLADGACFLSLERREDAKARGVRPLATFVAASVTCDARGPLMGDDEGFAFEEAMRSALAKAGLAPTDIGLVLTCASSQRDVDQRELLVLSRVFAKGVARPALGAFSQLFGHLKEAGGLLEIALTETLYARGEMPLGIRHPAAEEMGFASEIDPRKPYAMILRASPWGEYSCLLIRREDGT